MTTPPIIAATGAVVGTKALQLVLTDAYTSSKAAISKRFRKWREEDQISHLYEHIATVRKVKTIWQIDRELDLLEFYHPTRVEDSRDRRATVSTVDDLPVAGNTLVEGIVGQGKSIFLRYLCSQELYRGKAIPLFFELRRMSQAGNITRSLCERLSSLGFEIDEMDFRELAADGKVILFLDGFDELADEVVPLAIDELERLSDQFPKTRIIVTSRPDNQLAHSPKFRLCRLAPLAGREVDDVILKLTGGDELGHRLVASLKANPGEVQSILTTPLMITLLVITYRAFETLPETLSAFYEHLFEILWSRHDDSKPGYRRKKRVPINDGAVRRVFDAVCFITRKQNALEMQRNKLLEIAAEAIELRQAQCDEAAFIDDIKEITNLLLRDGANYRFIHKSVQEFHAASYIANIRDDRQSLTFYSAMVGQERWRSWKQELLFLRETDTLRFYRYFLIPETSRFCKEYLGGIPHEWRSTPIELICRLMNDCNFTVWIKHGNDYYDGLEYHHFDGSPHGGAFAAAWADYDRAEGEIGDAIGAALTRGSSEFVAAIRDSSPTLVDTGPLGSSLRKEGVEVFKVHVPAAIRSGAMDYCELDRIFTRVIERMLVEYRYAQQYVHGQERAAQILEF